MKTLAQNYNLAFDWHFALSRPDLFEFGELTRRSGSWVTCAVGNECDLIPRTRISIETIDGETNYGGGEPMDFLLSEFGFRFHNLVHAKNWEAALKCLGSIEARSLFLINEIKATHYVEQPAVVLLLL